MGSKEIIKEADSILSNKKKFNRALVVVIVTCITLIAIAGIGFYTGALSYHAGDKKIEKPQE